MAAAKQFKVSGSTVLRPMAFRVVLLRVFPDEPIYILLRIDGGTVRYQPQRSIE